MTRQEAHALIPDLADRLVSEAGGMQGALCVCLLTSAELLRRAFGSSTGRRFLLAMERHVAPEMAAEIDRYQALLPEETTAMPPRATPPHFRVPRGIVTSGLWAMLSPSAAKLFVVLCTRPPGSPVRLTRGEANLCGAQPKTLRRAARELERVGLLAVEQRAGGPNHYKLTGGYLASQ